MGKKNESSERGKQWLLELAAIGKASTEAVGPLPVEKIDHPAHYGGEDSPTECIKVIEAWGLGFCLGNCIKYLSRAGKKGDRLEDLKKALWYLQREITNETKEKP